VGLAVMSENGGAAAQLPELEPARIRADLQDLSLRNPEGLWEYVHRTGLYPVFLQRCRQVLLHWDDSYLAQIKQKGALPLEEDGEVCDLCHAALEKATGTLGRAQGNIECQRGLPTAPCLLVYFGEIAKSRLVDFAKQRKREPSTPFGTGRDREDADLSEDEKRERRILSELSRTRSPRAMPVRGARPEKPPDEKLMESEVIVAKKRIAEQVKKDRKNLKHQRAIEGIEARRDRRALANELGLKPNNLDQIWRRFRKAAQDKFEAEYGRKWNE